LSPSADIARRSLARRSFREHAHAVAYRFQRDESAAHAVRRVVRRALRDAVSLARDQQRDVDERIHEVRLCLKRARAALQLVAAETGRRAHRARRELRDVGRSLAPARDRAVAREALGGVARRLSAGARRGPSKLLPRLRKELGGDGAQEALDDAARALDKALGALPRFHVAHGARALSDGFERAYRRARRAQRRCRTDDAAVRFHDWRKAVKRLRYQAQLLGDGAPSLVAAMEPLLERLGQLLGELHDVTFLSEAVAEVGASRELRAERDRWSTHLEARADALRAETRALGASVFSEKPSIVGRRVATSWSRWRASRAL
jgi:CHAD domain-containing protein